MKINIISLLLLFFLFSITSCNDWLEIEPKSQIDKDKLYSEEIGFQNALNGIYQGASQSVLYGQNLTWGLLCAMGQTYDPESLLENEAYFAEYVYDNNTTKPVISDIWLNLYKLIANCNALLNEVSVASPSLFELDTVSKNVIMGEALALRAFFHFDVIRLFAPAPKTQDNRALIPYQAEWPSELKKKLSATEAIDEVIKDLLRAKDLVAYNDTLFNAYGMYTFDSRINGTSGAVKGGTFMKYRGYRMNYAAVLGMLARAYLYKGDRDNALAYAQQFYDFFVKKKKWFKWNASWDFETDLAYMHKKHLSDCLFAFYNGELLNNHADYQLSYGEPFVLQGISQIFGEDEDDYRLTCLMEGKEDYWGDKSYTSVKYKEITGSQTNMNTEEGCALPNLRMSEIYYILIECLYHKGDKQQALALLKDLRGSRGCKGQIRDINSGEELEKILINDARREFVGEGQLFFMYKRLNRPILTGETEIKPSADVFVLGIPDNQNIF